jgi:hypothetical protein
MGNGLGAYGDVSAIGDVSGMIREYFELIRNILNSSGIF